MPPGLKKPLEVWHLLLAVGLPIVGYLLMAGMTYADFKNTDRDHEKRITRVELNSANTDYNVIVIGEKLGLGPRMKR